MKLKEHFLNVQLTPFGGIKVSVDNHDAVEAAIDAQMKLDEARGQRIDAAMLADKQTDGYGQRNAAAALTLQIKSNPDQWGAA